MNKTLSSIDSFLRRVPEGLAVICLDQGLCYFVPQHIVGVILSILQKTKLKPSVYSQEEGGSDLALPCPSVA